MKQLVNTDRSIVSFLIFLICLILALMTSYAQNVSIPDANFKNALLTHDPVIDTNGDMEIQFSEAEAFTGSMDVSVKSIADATGIEAFSNLTRLIIYSNNLSSLDVSANTSLTFLFATSNSLSSVDLSGTILLDSLILSGNQLVELDVSNNGNLEYLAVAVNELTQLDVSNNLKLKNIFFSDNSITDFTFSPAIASSVLGVGIGGNPLSNSFDFTQFPNLEFLDCRTCGLTSIDVSGYPNLKTLLVMDNPITSIDLSKNTALEIIYGANTHVADWDLSANPNLTVAFFTSNDFFETESLIETINLANGNNEAITDFYVGNNPKLTCIQVDDPQDPFPNATGLVLNGFTNFRDQCVAGQIIFDDKEFEAALLDHIPAIDLNGDEVISEEEAAEFTGVLDLKQKPIKNVNEIQYFTNITGLDVGATEIGNLDLSQNAELATLDISDIPELRILSLDNGNNEAITSITWRSYFPSCITVDDPAFAEANWDFFPEAAEYNTDCDAPVGNTTFESRLIADGYDLNSDGEIQVSEAELITELRYTAFTNLFLISGFEAFTALEILELPVTYSGNSINLTQNPKLHTLKIPSSVLNSIDLSVNPILNTLDLRDANSSSFQSLDLSNNPGLTSVTLSNGNFEEVDLPATPGLQTLYVENNDILSLDLSELSGLRFFRANDNNLEYLNLANGNNTNLWIPAFDIRNNPELTCVTVDDPDFAIKYFQEYGFILVDSAV